MPRIVTAFVDQHPAVRLHIEERTADEIEAGVAAGELQLGISFVPSARNDLDAEALFAEDLVLVVPGGHPLAGRECAHVAELSDLPMALLAADFCTRRLWDVCAQQAGIEPKTVVEVNTIGGVLTLAERMGLATVAPALALSMPQAQHLHSVRLVNPMPTRTVGLLFRRNAYRCAATEAFGALVRLSMVETEAMGRAVVAAGG